MAEIHLTGLRADLPIGFMAACGCLRICERRPAFRGARLRWVPFGGSYIPFLSIPATADEFVQALISDVKSAPGRFAFTWSDQIKSVSKGDFVSAMTKACANSDWESLEWFAAFGTELCVGEDGAVKSTPFDMSVARQRFLADAVKLATALSAPEQDVHRSYQEALFGPWLYQDDQHSLGWDPSTMKLGAFTYKAPTGMPNAGVRAAVWLAFESLPLFPCFYNGGLLTRAFRSHGRTDWFHWPVWECPLSLAAVHTLLSWPVILEEVPDSEEIEARGVIAVYRSARFKPNKYLASFRMPELIYARGTSSGVSA
jgi:hypothetical protein